MAQASKEEVVMDAFRLMRTGRYLKAKDLRAAVKEMHPELDDTFIQDVFKDLARIAQNMER